jgi:hypothetical protein
MYTRTTDVSNRRLRDVTLEPLGFQALTIEDSLPGAFAPSTESRRRRPAYMTPFA